MATDSEIVNVNNAIDGKANMASTIYKTISGSDVSLAVNDTMQL